MRNLWPGVSVAAQNSLSEEGWKNMSLGEVGREIHLCVA